MFSRESGPRCKLKDYRASGTGTKSNVPMSKTPSDPFIGKPMSVRFYKVLQSITTFCLRVTAEQTCSWSHGGIVAGLTMFLFPGRKKPSSSKVNGFGIEGSWKLGGTTICSTNWGGGIGGA